MFKWLFNLFKKKKMKVDEFIEEGKEELVEIVRRGFTITLPKKNYEFFVKQGYTFSLTLYKGKPSCVQLKIREDQKTIYRGTLKDWLEVKSFKDGNVCNFASDNIVKE